MCPGPDAADGQFPDAAGNNDTGEVTPPTGHPVILCPTKITPTSPQTVKEGDTLPDIAVILQDANGVAVDLSSATEIVFRFRNKLDTAGPQSRDAQIVNAALGAVSAGWGPFVEGEYETEFHVSWTDGEVTFPDNAYLNITVIAAVK